LLKLIFILLKLIASKFEEMNPRNCDLTHAGGTRRRRRRRRRGWRRRRHHVNTQDGEAERRRLGAHARFASRNAFGDASEVRASTMTTECVRRRRRNARDGRPTWRRDGQA